MRTFLAFTKKELSEQLRSGRLWILLAIFVLFGIMNPAVAKITPWLLEIMADSLAESGMTVTNVTVSAMDSWVQFFKNMPMALIAFVLLQSTIFTREYGAGTLVLSLTKGLERFKIVLSKAAVLLALWTFCFWLCFGITYAYNAYFWDNSVAQHLFSSCAFWWLFGALAVALITLLSTLVSSGTGVLLGTGGILFAFYLLGIIPKVGEYLPTRLTEGTALTYGTADVSAYTAAVVITLFTIVACFVASIFVFNKKQL